ncbi:TetR/AcrR family transcriptional regulator [Streptomyces sp. NPDC059979]|uniref:LmrA/YxaF family transcription factor n=1 Tax=Streptomyces sp. NPDC059979 TaxID=3347021 RepID=UPI003683A2CA
MGEEVVRTSGAAYLALIGELFGQPGGDPAEATREAFRGAALTLEALDFADPCPIATVALEVAGTHEGLRPATAEVFASWIEALAGYYASCGLSAPRSTASSVIALLEGAFMLGRAGRSPEPVLTAATAAAAIVAAAARA